MTGVLGSIIYTIRLEDGQYVQKHTDQLRIRTCSMVAVVTEDATVFKDDDLDSPVIIEIAAVGAGDTEPISEDPPPASTSDPAVIMKPNLSPGITDPPDQGPQHPSMREGAFGVNITRTLNRTTTL